MRKTLRPVTITDRIRKLREQLPHLTDGDVARACKCDLEEVQATREAFEDRGLVDGVKRIPA
jgi:hypothetical protein